MDPIIDDDQSQGFEDTPPKKSLIQEGLTDFGNISNHTTLKKENLYKVEIAPNEQFWGQFELTKMKSSLSNLDLSRNDLSRNESFILMKKDLPSKSVT